MLEKIIHWSIANRKGVLLGVVGFVLLSVWGISRLKVDAIPDLSDTQVVVQATLEGQPPQVVEDQITYPLTTRMLSVPGAKSVRGYSSFGYSLVYILFEDGTDLYWARSRVLESLNSVQGILPQGTILELGPDATSVGWIFQYALRDTTGKYTLADLKDIQQYYLRYELTALKGVSEVATAGGYQREFQVEVNPSILYQYGISMAEIELALKKSNRESGGGVLEKSESRYMVLLKGYIETVDDIKMIPVRVNAEGGVLRLGDIAYVKEGPGIRRGLVDLNGEGEVVGAVVLMRQGEDVLSTIALVKERLAQLEKTLPEGVEVVVTYDRSGLINRSIDNLGSKLVEELLVVAFVTILFLLHVRSALVAVVLLPLGVLGALLAMSILGINANIMSLGGIAIAIGVMVDSSVVMVENLHKHLEFSQRGGHRLSDSEYWEVTRKAVSEIAPGLFWSLLIIVVSFLPVFALPEQSGRMFTPLAFTKTLSMGFGAVLSVVVMPVFIGYFVRGTVTPEDKHPVSRVLVSGYLPVLKWCLDRKTGVIAAAVLLFIVSWIPWTGITNFSDSGNSYLVEPIGSEFIPQLEEGDLLYMPTTSPGISIAKARELMIKTDQLIMEIPEVKQVFGKAGRAETATDPAPLMMLESTILLKDKSQWREGFKIEDIIRELDQHVRIPGVVNAWTMPVRARLDMLSTGIKTPIGVKIYGENLNTIEKLSKAIETKLSEYEGVVAIGDRPGSEKYLVYEIDREVAAIYGLNIADIHSAIVMALGGKSVTEVIKGSARWSASIRYMRSYRESFEDLNDILISLPEKRGQIPVSRVVKVINTNGPGMIKSENGRKSGSIYIDSQVYDTGSLAELVENSISKWIESGEIEWETGYSFQLSGQYEQIRLASRRMALLFPLVLVIVFVILYLYFRRIDETLLVILTALLFAPAGGSLLMWISGYDRSVATDVGFIALVGLAAETGVLMIHYIKLSLESMKGKISADKVREAVIEGAVLRVRPKIMTVVTTIAGLLPLFWGDQPGNNAMRRIALPITGGLISSTLVTLILIPVLYEFIHTSEMAKKVKEMMIRHK